ncbi:type I-E CRISPR-associated protein Cse2/CasB [Silanimonas sp.]|uniref:type I-E CRISPR-associated protein Cse2/CasB n=1 Tax=Silanimonas sp. TaxID=1929290 RepID=UPI001BBCCF6F|nr:type I-E CRISPR-associated protein Cse2/CasB [Silanimonas sp.]MBS3896245.1 type I-E CRISPR-associated protein Cse2/CasB [Silanimonas sp.]
MNHVNSPHPLVTYLRRAQDPAGGDRALLAVLRRSLGQAPGDDLRAVARLEGLIVRLQGEQALGGERQRRHAYLVAGLLAWCRTPGTDNLASLGHCLAQLCLSSNRDKQDSVERRLAHLVDADEEQLPMLLRATVRLLDQAEIVPDFSLLLRQLDAWNHPDRWVQRRWLRDFHHSLSTDRDDAA